MALQDTTGNAYCYLVVTRVEQSYVFQTFSSETGLRTAKKKVLNTANVPMGHRI
jgi:hypothetical protein